MHVVICGNYGVGNLGDEAILSGLRKFLEKTLGEVEISVLGKGSLFPLGVRSFFKSLVSHRMWRHPMRVVRSSDLAILGGGGLFSDEEGFQVGSFWALQGLAMRYIGKKPLFIMGISIGHLNFLGRFWVQRACKAADFISVRDRRSLEILHRWGIKAVRGSDFALLNSVDTTEDAKNEKPYIALSIRPFKKYDHLLYTKIARVCSELVEKNALHIKFLCFSPKDRKNAYLKNKIFDHIEGADFQKTLQLIAGAQLVIAMRLHAGIFSLIGKTPFIPLSYMNKVTDFWSEFPEIESEDIASIQRDTFEKSLLDKIEFILSNQQEQIRKLEDIHTTLSARLSYLEKLFCERLSELAIALPS